MASVKSTTLPIRNRVAIGHSLAVLFCPAPNGKVYGVTVDREDVERVLAFGFWRVACFGSPSGRARGIVKLYCYTSDPQKASGRIIYLHRFLLDAPKDRAIEGDHIYGRTLDNRKSEIRLVTRSFNQVNRQSAGRANKFGLRGVKRSRSGRYVAIVRFNRRAKQFGTFDTPGAAGERVRTFLAENSAHYALQEVRA